MMWQESSVVTLYQDAEIETVAGKIVRGAFIRPDTFRSLKGDLHFDWLRWRLIEESDDDILETL